MSWSNYIDNIYAEAPKPLVYNRRCLHSAPPALRQLAYEIFVRPKIDYAAASGLLIKLT